MKRCPTCNQTFDEDWLAFCTQDGTTLIEESTSTSGPPPTILSSAPPHVSAPPQSTPSAPPPAVGYQQPSGGFSPGPFGQPQPMQAGWQPPPPPAVVAGPAQGLAIASMICGLFSVTIGWCCYLGVVSSPVAICLGAYQLVQIKNHPDQFGGKPFAITGIVAGSLYFVLLAILIILYGAMIFMGSMGSH
jgi:hypothetical protein